ncbi:hypothetical protein H6P81_010322 [Aristolochia fimbriata]|uniref:DUF4218 domain-containing protein n=1 Tax=Aristolochia fimbriata TaxID=158543 RepID=A0AAV7ERU4_ARIFI|nr:hypothetical protein H6P81_010322 [Aristolochia fimbriata]
MDMERLNIRKPLHPKPSRKKTGEFVIPHASYQMSMSAKERFFKVLKDLKLPDGFSTNISKNVREGKLVGLKNHDCHVLMQQLLPLALRTTVAKPVATVLIEYCNFFKELCSKTVELNRLEALEQKILIILCNFEKIFPPAFFDVMVHLTIHLATEAKVVGLIQYRWMYPIERYLLTLKNYIRNNHRPKGSIAEGYLMEEVTTFCARYVHGMETKLNRPVRYEEGPIGVGTSFWMTANESYQAHRFIPFNNENVMSYIEYDKNRLCVPDEVVKAVCMTNLCQSIKKWRNKLKKKYDKKNEEEKKICGDKRLTQEEWDLLVKYWESEEVIESCRRNKVNRSHAQATNTLGSKSIAQHYAEERERFGDDFTVLGSYLSAHRKKDGSYHNTYTQEKCIWIPCLAAIMVVSSGAWGVVGQEGVTCTRGPRMLGLSLSRHRFKRKTKRW